ncbi:hypothetical protein F511_11221 [Dorcoceras hygrometricum]|uniref:Uncharacterized protein n=1 Tax=Dorcoceras hygrometricum TaxID=472368 RepID=A0A2Z7CD61_9LAMI|nr:hypothetical protein F511_11221 [Dorcoceras hygrometricum]
MASSLFVNTLQVNFASVPTTEHAGMVRMFKSLEDTGLQGFLEVRVHGGNFCGYHSQPGKILFQRLLGMVQNPKKQSQGYIVPVRMLMEILVKADLGPSIKLHAKKMLTSIQGGGRKKQSKTVAMQVTMPAPQTIATQTIENRGTVAPTNFDSEEDSESDSCPLVQRRCRKKQVSESSDSEATNSIPLTHYLKRRRTQRQHQQSGWTGVTIATQPDLIPASTTDPEEIPDGHISQGGGDAHLDEDLVFNARTEHDGGKDQEITTDSRDGSHHDSIPLVPTEGEENIADDEQLDTGSHKPAKIVSAQNVQMKADPASVDTHIHYRGFVGLPFITPAFSYSESDYLPKPFPALELDTLAGYEQYTAQTMSHQIEHPGNEDTAMLFHEHQAQETEPTSQTDEPQNEGYEHQYAAEPRSNHTAKLCDQLKTTADGLDIKIDVLERTLTQRMVDELDVVKSQLAAIVEGLKETGASKKGESGPSSRPRGGSSGDGPSSHGGKGRGRIDNPALSSSSLECSIDINLETGVAGFEEREVVAVFVYLRDC